MAALAKIGLGTSAALLALTVAEPAVAWAGPKSTTVPCTGQGALVTAINAANTAGGGTLNLSPGCDYALTAADNGENGLPVILTPIAINGNGATIDGTGAVRDLEVDGPGGSLSAQNLTLTGGSAQDFGGAIANIGGAVTLNHTQVTGNTAVVAGGGIANATFDPASVAQLTLNNSSVTHNTQTLPGDPLNPGDGGIGGGGIISLLGTVTLNSSQVSYNAAEGLYGGGIANGDYMNFSSTSSVLTLNNSQVDGNTAPIAGGGGIQNLLGQVTLNSSQADGNTSLNGGGISSGNGNGNSQGTPTSQLVLNKSDVSGNTATATLGAGAPPIAAGGIANGGNAVLNSTTVDNNTATHTSGAGIVNHGSMTLNKSEVNGNIAAGQDVPNIVASGGGIITAQGPQGTNATTLTLNNSQVNNNSAVGDGGGIANGLPLPPQPGVPQLLGGTVTLNHSQVTGNTAGSGGGIFNYKGTVSLSGTSVNGNTPNNCAPATSVPGCVN
jgi:hypothetical protein